MKEKEKKPFLKIRNFFFYLKKKNFWFSRDLYLPSKNFSSLFYYMKKKIWNLVFFENIKEKIRKKKRKNLFHFFFYNSKNLITRMTQFVEKNIDKKKTILFHDYWLKFFQKSYVKKKNNCDLFTKKKKKSFFFEKFKNLNFFFFFKCFFCQKIFRKDKNFVNFYKISEYSWNLKQKIAEFFYSKNSTFYFCKNCKFKTRSFHSKKISSFLSFFPLENKNFEIFSLKTHFLNNKKNFRKKNTKFFLKFFKKNYIDFPRTFSDCFQLISLSPHFLTIKNFLVKKITFSKNNLAVSVLLKKSCKNKILNKRPKKKNNFTDLFLNKNQIKKFKLIFFLFFYFLNCSKKFFFGF
ncbi:hypothetical protein HAN_2g350 (nucleomorph) [Hemiselmis andersenii]|uniref:Uncharacterized protein n=1 Tax=Hemiselmis andersenii TaxID=464988 RepID=A9BKJ5_HEMAN|nr:hypothetical protein HAN_2g350 [Hemiselmis andersenii]ABW98166.1 hypothetical protein HAN_2g350 [Hemiselmis andersenii]